MGYYKCPGPPHQWCRIWEQRQANPLSCCVCECVWWTEMGRETGLGYRQLLRVCTVCVEPWEASHIPPHHFHFITPGERTYIIQLFKPQSAGTNRAFNKHFNLNSPTDPPAATLSVYLLIPHVFSQFLYHCLTSLSLKFNISLCFSVSVSIFPLWLHLIPWNLKIQPGLLNN